jgi:hypothetical protein
LWNNVYEQLNAIKTFIFVNIPKIKKEEFDKMFIEKWDIVKWFLINKHKDAQ